MNIILLGSEGHVGKALYATLKEQHNIIKVDKEINHYCDSVKIDGIIVALPTPTVDGKCDVTIIDQVLSNFDFLDVPILIKSTIDLVGFRYLKTKIDKDRDLSYSPEFIREKTAVEDMAKEYHFMCHGNTDFWFSVFANSYDRFSIQNLETLILTKYIRNSYLATKVSFFNEVYRLCQQMDIDYDSVRLLVQEDKRIGTSHMNVPGDHGLGYGGSCFPKDVQALINMAQFHGGKFEILTKVDEVNSQIKALEAYKRSLPNQQ